MKEGTHAHCSTFDKEHDSSALAISHFAGIGFREEGYWQLQGRSVWCFATDGHRDSDVGMSKNTHT
jgi:hypothetical protein